MCFNISKIGLPNWAHQSQCGLFQWNGVVLDVPIVLYQSDLFPEEEEEDTPPMAPQLLSSSNFKSLFDSVDTFLFDCDGRFYFLPFDCYPL